MVPTQPPKPPLRVVSVYKAVALLVLNTLVVFVVLNGLAALVLEALPDPELEGAMSYGLPKLRQVYPGRSDEEIRDLLEETWSRTYAYEPFTQFKEGRHEGDYVTVSEAGFRSHGVPPPWPPTDDRINVFVFGGSTTFGYGVADAETIPARLGALLSERCEAPVAVYNLARSNYYSTQERILFQQLILKGIRPDLAIFVDGLNELGSAADEPKFTGRLSYMMAETGPQMTRRLLVGLPLARLAKRWLDRPDHAQRVGANEAQATEVVARWLANREQTQAVATAAGIDTLFVWQPIPYFEYDLEAHVFGGDDSGEGEAHRLAYRAVDSLRAQPDGPLSHGFLWLGDLQRGRSEALYVDRVHYTAAFSVEVAEGIATEATARVCSPWS